MADEVGAAKGFFGPIGPMAQNAMGRGGVGNNVVAVNGCCTLIRVRDMRQTSQRLWQQTVTGREDHHELCFDVICDDGGHRVNQPCRDRRDGKDLGQWFIRQCGLGGLCICRVGKDQSAGNVGCL